LLFYENKSIEYSFIIVIFWIVLYFKIISIYLIQNNKKPTWSFKKISQRMLGSSMIFDSIRVENKFKCIVWIQTLSLGKRTQTHEPEMKMDPNICQTLRTYEGPPKHAMCYINWWINTLIDEYMPNAKNLRGAWGLDLH
jgi:hypothetical protein